MNEEFPMKPRTPSSPMKAGSNDGRPVLSVVVPCFNEEEIICDTNRRLQAVLDQAPVEFEIIYVDDGSTDSTPELLRQLQESDERVRIVRFSRNFGHQMAITAGIEHGSGDAVVVIDADLQDPPEVILEFVQKWTDGYDVVYGVRAEREGETAFKVWTAKAFYRCIARLSETRIPLDTGDFRLMDRRVVNALLGMPERDRFVRGMVSWLGFSQVGVSYRREAAFCDGRNLFVFGAPFEDCHLDGFRGIRSCDPGHRRRCCCEAFRCARLGQRLDESVDRRPLHWRRAAYLHRNYRRVRWPNLWRVQAAPIVRDERATGIRGETKRRGSDENRAQALRT
jgi:glycosyltransferase involved in cell wall biosynthesis